MATNHIMTRVKNSGNFICTASALNLPLFCMNKAALLWKKVTLNFRTLCRESLSTIVSLMFIWLGRQLFTYVLFYICVMILWLSSVPLSSRKDQTTFACACLPTSHEPMSAVHRNLRWRAGGRFASSSISSSSFHYALTTLYLTNCFPMCWAACMSSSLLGNNEAFLPAFHI